MANVTAGGKCWQIYRKHSDCTPGFYSDQQIAIYYLAKINNNPVIPIYAHRVKTPHPAYGFRG